MANSVSLNHQNGNHGGHRDENSHDQTQTDLQLPSTLTEEEMKITPMSFNNLGQGEEYDQDIKLLLKIAHELQTTGECPLPDIEDLVSTVYELREEMPKVLLPVAVVKQLNNQLKASCDRIFDYSDDLAQYVDRLIAKLSDGSQLDQAIFMDTFNHIKRILPELSHSIAQILNIVRQVDRLLANQDSSNLDLGSDFFETSTSKMIGDLRYFQAYLCQQGSAKLFNMKHYEVPYYELHYRRFQHYIFMLPIVCKNLTNQTQQRLESSIPGFPINAKINL